MSNVGDAAGWGLVVAGSPDAAVLGFIADYLVS
jgi:hypothetical protein